MCGISGIYSLNGKVIENLENRIQLMTDMLHHRGPDQKGIYISEKKNFALSNNRLSIVSPKEKIELPFTKNKNEFLSFNGEIYNYLELRDELKRKNINFITSTDTEVMYEFIRNFKFDNFKKINGMWSLAYYNERKHELNLTRDLLGERHLFYTINNNELIFSSEARPIVAVALNSIDMDFNSMIASWKFNSSLPGKTLMKNVFRINSGTLMRVLNNKIEVNRIQKLHPEKWFDFFRSSPSPELVDKKFVEIFSKNLNLRIPNEVEYFSTLSGGIDSAVVAYFTKKILNKRVHSLFGITGDEQDVKTELYESELAASFFVARKLNLHHQTTKINVADSIKEINYIAGNCFDGCIDAATATFGGFAQHVKANSGKVMIVAEGPDEFLGGYVCDIEANKIDKTIGPNTSLRFLKNLSGTKVGRKFLINFMNLEKNKEFEFRYEPFYTRVNHLVCPNEFLNSITKNFDFKTLQDYGTVDPIYNNIIPEMDLTQIRALNYASKSLPDMFNLRLDKAFMRHSVEVRLPYESIEVAEFFLAMPSSYRFKNGIGKNFLRKFVSQKIDKAIALRPKQGLGPNLWRDKNIFKEMNMDEEILSSDFFENFPFVKNIKEILIDKTIHPGNKWAAYALIKTFENCKNYNQLKK